MSSTVGNIIILSIIIGSIAGYIIFLLLPTNQDVTIYKNYRIGNHTFTVHLNRDSDKDVQIKVCEWHLPPRNRWQFIKQMCYLKVYKNIYWRPTLRLSNLSLDEFIIQTIEEVINQEKEKNQLDEEWKKFIEDTES